MLVYSPLCRRGEHAGHLVRERTTRTARRACSSRAMRCLLRQVRPNTEKCGQHTDSFRISRLQSSVSHDRSRGKQGSAGPRVALPKPSRREGIPISAPHKYEGQPRDLQPVFWASFGTQKIPVKPRVFGVREHRQNLSDMSISQFRPDFSDTSVSDLENTTTVYVPHTVLQPHRFSRTHQAVLDCRRFKVLRQGALRNRDSCSKERARGQRSYPRKRK